MKKAARRNKVALSASERWQSAVLLALQKSTPLKFSNGTEH